MTNPLNEMDLTRIEESKLILVPIEFTDSSLPTGKYAVQIAKQLDCDLKFHHIFSDPEAYNTRIASISAFENYQESVHQQEEKKSKKLMQEFATDIHKYADEAEFPKSKIHFSLSSGKVSEQIIQTIGQDDVRLVILGASDEMDFDDEKGVVRTTIHKTKVPVITLPLKGLGKIPAPILAFYISENKDLAKPHLKIIKELFLEKLDLQVFVSEKSEPESRIFEEAGATVINEDSIDDPFDYMVDKGISLVIVDKPKGGIIGSIFGKDFSDKMYKQQDIPVLFLG